MPAVPLALVLLAALMALAYGWRYVALPPGAARSLVKVLAIAPLALAALIAGAPPLIVLGLAAGAIGDFFLSREGEPAFLAGMAAFGIGHLAYASAFYGGADLPWLPALALVALGLSTEVWLAPRTGALRWPVRIYVVLIVAMALSALTLGVGQPLILAGALFFVLSDLLLALDLFVVRPPRPWLGRLLWAFYWSGQALILWGMIARSA